MPEFNNDITAIIDYVGNTFHETKEVSYLEFWRGAEFDYHLNPDRRGPSEFYLRVGLKAPVYRALGNEAMRTGFEERVQEIAEPVVNRFDDLWMRGVYVYPIAEVDDSWRGGTERPIQASTAEVSRIWKPGCFRLFLSHSSSDKDFATSLKESLERVQIDAFVAHLDIEPNLAWQEEIRLGLASCHAVVFLSSTLSNRSVWCQQEVGWGLGRGVFVTSYKLSNDPVGFAGANQAWNVPNNEIHKIRKKLLVMLAKDDRTEPSMHEPLVQLMLASNSAGQINYALDYLEILKSLSQSDLQRLSNILSQPFVSQSKQLVTRLQATLASFGLLSAPTHAPQPADDYDPFADE